MQYGSLEYAYAEPIAQALVDDRHFRQWVLEKTKFAGIQSTARLLDQEMQSKRRASTWWRSHFTERCRCPGCSGQETDLLAIFEDENGGRFAIHFEVKQPTDRFAPSGNQGANYAIRAECWIANPPPAVLPHSATATVLLCSELSLQVYSIEAAKFDSVITFEKIRASFPDITLPRAQLTKLEVLSTKRT